jgi:pimeloyl-ACP methyl ester carboxylesterase
MVLGFERSTLRTDDGVELAVFSHTPKGWDAEGHPTLFLSNGLGGNLVTWKHVVEHFRATHRIATWDYRGLYESTFSPALKERFRRGDLRVELPVHAQDAARVIEHLGIERAVFFGWSMGVQLNFELARTHRHVMAGLVQICGAAGKAIATTVFGKTGLVLIPSAMDAFRVVAERGAPLLSRLVGSPLALQLAKSVGIVAPSIDAVLARQVVDSYLRQDFEVYNTILMSLAAHDARRHDPARGRSRLHRAPAGRRARHPRGRLALRPGRVPRAPQRARHDLPRASGAARGLTRGLEREGWLAARLVMAGGVPISGAERGWT